MFNNIQESAKNGDTDAISRLIERAIKGATVESKIYNIETLELSVKSAEALDTKACTDLIIKTLNEIQPAKITTVMIFGASSKQKWNKFLSFKSGKYKENTMTVKAAIFAIFAMLACPILWAALSPKSESTINTCSKARLHIERAMDLRDEITPEESLTSEGMAEWKRRRDDVIEARELRNKICGI